MPETKVLLVGPYPPPHGGISVHVAGLERELRAAGVTCRVLDLDPRAAPRDGCLALRGGTDLLRIVYAHARAGYAIHLHTNGHGLKSWLIVLACAVAGRPAPALVVTLHSGMLPDYLARASWPLRTLAQWAALGYSRIVCVNAAIRAALLANGVPAGRLLVRPAFIPPPPAVGGLPPDLEAWLSARDPVLSSTLFFRHEYGLDLLLEAVDRLRAAYPRVGCVVMGSGDSRAAQAFLDARGLHENVRFAGDLDHEDCLKVMARSDVFVRPSRADGDSISVREAVALGVRTVASDVGTRPAGVRLFPAGDQDALVRALVHALAAEPIGTKEDAGHAPAHVLG